MSTKSPKTILLFSLIAVITLSFGSMAFADVPTPLTQLNSGIEPHDIQCNENKVLVERANGKISCVTEKTALKTGWEIIEINFDMNEVLKEFPVKWNEEISDNEASQISVEKQKMHFELETTNRGGHSSGYGLRYPPVITLDVPRNVSVGETFSVDYTIHWVNEDGKPSYPQLTSIEEKSKIFVYPYFEFPDEFEVNLGTDSSYRGVYVNIIQNHMLIQNLGEKITYDASQIISGSFEMKLTKPMVYELDNLLISFTGGGGEYFQVVSNENGVELIPESELGSDFEFFPTMLGRYMSGYHYDVETGFWKHDKTILPSDIRGLPDLTSPSLEPSLSIQLSTDLKKSPEYMPKVHWESFAEFLRDHTPNDDTPMREWLLSENMSEEFIDDFLEEYPEFLIQDIDFRFSLIPEAQAAVPKMFYAYGNFLVEDYNGQIKGGNNIKVCAFDVEENAIPIVDTHMLKDGIYDACKQITATSGSFTITGENYDADDPHTDIDLILGFVLENENMIVVSILGDTDPVTIHEIFPDGLDDDRKNMSSTVINLGDINAHDDMKRWYSVIDIPSMAFEKLDSKTSYEIPFVTLAKDRNLDTSFEYFHGGADHDYIENTIIYEYGNAFESDLRDIPALLLHEYGHHVQHRIYEDNHNSEIPPCDSHNFDEFLLESCGWSEGWAWFFSTWMLDENLVSLGLGFDNVDFENTLMNVNTRDEESFLRSDSFDGSKNEGWVAATLWDIIDGTGESGNDDIANLESKLWQAFVTNDAQTIFEFESDWDSVSSNSLNSIFDLNTIREDTGEAPPTDSIILKENWQVSLPSSATYATDSDSFIVNLNRGDVLEFDYTVSSEVGYDWGRIYIDDVQIFETSGEVSDIFSYTVLSAGLKTLKIEYYKDGLENHGDDLFKINKLTKYSMSGDFVGNVIFEDNFNTDLSNWDLTGDKDWKIDRIIISEGVPSFADGSYVYQVADADNCDDKCIMTLDGTRDLTNYDELYLSFWYFLGDRIDSDDGEGLLIEGSTNGGASWESIIFYTEDAGATHNWEEVRGIDISDFAGFAFKLRITGISDSGSDYIQIAELQVHGILGSGGGSGSSNNAPEINITSPEIGDEFDEGDSITFTVNVSDDRDSDIESRVSWSSDKDGILGSGSSITPSDLSVNTHTITASATDSGGKSASDSIIITVIENPVGIISLIDLFTYDHGFTQVDIIKINSDENIFALIGQQYDDLSIYTISVNADYDVFNIIEKQIVSTLESKSANSQIILISDNMYAVVYQNNHIGMIETFLIQPDGQISELHSIGIPNMNDPSAAKINSDTFAIAYKNQDKKGIVKTISVDGHGMISITDTLEFNSFKSQQPKIIPIDSDTFVIAFKSGMDGYLKTINVNSSEMNIADTLQTQEGIYPDITHVRDNLFAIAYQSVDAVASLSTVTIDNEGQMYLIDNGSYAVESAINPNILSVSNDIIAIVYTTDITGELQTISINSDGTIGDTLDKYEFPEMRVYDPKIIHISEDAYVISFSTSNYDSELGTFYITD